MPTTILAIAVFVVGMGIGILIEHLRFTMGFKIQLETESEELVKTINRRDRDIARLTRDNENLTFSLKSDQSRQILESVGWLPLKGACLPSDGDRIQVAGLMTDSLQQAPPGFHYARFKRRSDGQAQLSDSSTAVIVNLNGSVLWRPQ